MVAPPARKGPKPRGRLARLGAAIRERYMVGDPRTLAVFRIVLGFLLIADGLRHWSHARVYYSNSGVLTNHFHLFRPDGPENFSVFHAFSTIEEVHVLFALGTLAYFFFFVGYKTRLFAVLSFVFTTSMDNRLIMVENGGYVLVNLAVFYAMFMPTGRRFSVDAWLESFRRRRESTVEELNEARDATTEPYVSIVMLLAILNFATVYFFNVVNKSGQIWRSGETVHYVLHLDRMVTGLAVWLREILPMWALRPMAWVVLSVEALNLGLILAPTGRRITRPLVMILIFGLHTVLGVMMRLGPFSWFMIGWSMLLLTDVQWDGIERWHRRRARPVVAVVDRDSPVALFVGRVLRRLDPYGMVRFEPSQGDERPPLVEVRLEGEERGVSGTPALRRLVSAIVPGGDRLYGVLVAATFGALPWVWSIVDRERERVGRFFGLAAATPPPPPPPETTAPIVRLRQRGLRVTREVFLAYYGLCAVSQVLNENKAVPAPIKHEQPGFVKATIGYPRLYQGWGMFSPNPIQEDGVVAVDAMTIDGRRIDPFTGREPDLDLTDDRGLALNQIVQDYWNRIRLDRNRGYRDGLRQYLQRWHLETGRPEDELVAFDVYWVRDLCPAPGSRVSTDNEIVALLTYRKAGYRPAPGLPPLPPAPKVESAERHSKLPEPKKKEKENEPPPG